MKITEKFMGRTFLVVLVTGLVICLMAGCSTKKMPELRVATYNIAAGKKLDTAKQAAHIEKYKVDIVGLQEVDKYTERNNFDMLAVFTNKTYPYSYFGKMIDYQGGEYGTGIISRYPFIEARTAYIDSTGTKEQRGYERVVFKKDKREIAVYNTHISWETIEIRTKQLEELKAAVDADTVKYKIVTGDFNVDQNRNELDIFVRSGYKLSNGKEGIWFDTFRGEDETMKIFSIDNVIVSNNIDIVNVEMIDSDLSDHNMLYADLILLDK
jgi:endonuclease/exonuclease/phosphatase family metal-dependent hydrolase